MLLVNVLLLTVVLGQFFKLNTKTNIMQLKALIYLGNNILLSSIIFIVNIFWLLLQVHFK
jgi:hypothetical protein